MTHVEVTGAAVARFSRRDIGEFARKVLRALRPFTRRRITSLTIAFVDDETMTGLNRKFRKKNRTTDVLTFDDDSYADIVISIDQARRQAATEKHSLATEVRYLILHGILHAHGYDHETDQGEMNALEMKVRERVGLM